MKQLKHWEKSWKQRNANNDEKTVDFETKKKDREENFYKKIEIHYVI